MTNKKRRKIFNEMRVLAKKIVKTADIRQKNKLYERTKAPAWESKQFERVR
jgi:hypothetical protein